MLRSTLISLPARRLFLGLGLAAAGSLGACSSGGSKDAVETAQAQNERNINTADVTAKQEADASFLVKTTGNALLEVELGKLIQARASAPAARTYGAQLVQNRLELLTALRTLADAKKLAVPLALGNDEQAAYHEVSTQGGSKMDKAALELIVKAQKQDKNAFDDMKDDAYDGDIRGFAAKYYKPVQDQYEAADETNDAVKKLP